MQSEQAQKFAFDILEKQLPDNLFYHGFHHTVDVFQAAIRLCQIDLLDPESIDIVMTAVAYHDIGFVNQYQNNEPIGAEMARKVLPDFDFNPVQIQQVCDCIMATRMPQKPTNLLEQIICDADLDYLGRPDFYSIAHSLRNEWLAVGIFKDESLTGWYTLQHSFLSHHRYHTRAASGLREAQKQIHLSQLAQLLNK